MRFIFNNLKFAFNEMKFIKIKSNSDVTKYTPKSFAEM